MLDKEGRSYRTTREDRLDELAGFEVQSKMIIEENIDLSQLASSLFNFFSQESHSIFIISPSLPYIEEVSSNVYKYAHSQSNNQPKIDFTVSIRDRDGNIKVKRKGKKDKERQISIKQESKTDLGVAVWNSELRNKIITEEAAQLGLHPEEIFMFASMKKTKYKIRLENSQTSRAYTVGISQFSSDGNVFLRQIVTEYIGNEESKNIIHNQDSRITKIENDINHINDIVQGFLSKNCIPHSIDNRSAISYFKK